MATIFQINESCILFFFVSEEYFLNRVFIAGPTKWRAFVAATSDAVVTTFHLFLTGFIAGTSVTHFGTFSVALRMLTTPFTAFLAVYAGLTAPLFTLRMFAL
jgi:hypothetical protein